MSTNLCQYIKTCPIYQGKQETNGAPLALYKNVFCNRGYKGWENCEHYLEYNLNSKNNV
jgi:hypothetical protein